MNVSIMDFTESPIDLISVTMGTCYAKDNCSELRVKRAFEARHMGVFEHAKFTVRIDGVSRALTHQLVRHRMASFCQESQRYCKIDVSNGDWHVVPPSIERLGAENGYMEAMELAADEYLSLLEAGVPAEDARYALPNAAKTAIVMTMNLREFFEFLRLRKDSTAQWEIRELAELIERVVAESDEQWGWLLGLPYEQA